MLPYGPRVLITHVPLVAHHNLQKPETTHHFLSCLPFTDYLNAEQALGWSKRRTAARSHLSIAANLTRICYRSTRSTQDFLLTSTHRYASPGLERADPSEQASRSWNSTSCRRANV